MWFSKSAQAVLTELRVNPADGLTSAEAQARLEKDGPNKLKGRPRKSFLELFFAQLQDMLIYVLLGAAVITVVVGEWVDAAIILLVVFLNAVIGVVQESKAEKAIEALERLATPRAVVRRDGEVKEINSENVVAGDVIILDAGRYVPADLRLINSANLQIEESALTGESVPTEKNAADVPADTKTPIGDQANMAFMSTLVTYGRGEGIVVATAMDTEIGKIARILDDDVDEMTPLQKRLEELGKTLGYIALGITVLIFVISLFQDRPLFEMFLTAISLAVAAIPEGLPAIVAIVLALGVTRISRVNAIVRKLPAVETLGSVSIICSDKTGTLTQNRMTVVKFYTAGNLGQVPAEAGEFHPGNTDGKELIKSFVLCSDATYENGESTGDPTEVALVVFGEKYGLGRKKLQAEHKRVSEKPFDSDRKLMSTLTEEENGYRVHTKGALDTILKISSRALVQGKVVPLTEELKAEYLTVAETMSNDALRVLGAAYKDTSDVIEPDEMEKELTVIGLAGMIDPPRLEVKATIEKARKAGIIPVMITGDHKNTAVAIAKELGIASSMEQSITGSEIDNLSEKEFFSRCRNYRVFARVSPEHKVKIVKAFQSQGNIVSMTGDGVNDAPSLKVADIGVAMGITGTDVSKGASDMILTDDNFTTIVHAIEEGRNIYNNIKKTVIFLLACNLGEVVAILFAVMFYWPVPLLATQILWINLVTDSFPAIALGVDPGDKDVMNKKPRNPKESFFAHGAAIRVLTGGILIGLLTLTAFYFGLAQFGYSLNSPDIPEQVMVNARTMAFVVLAGTQLFFALSMRSFHKLVFQLGVFSNRYLIGAVVLGFILQFGVITIPFFANAFKVQNLSLSDWGLVLFFSLVPFLLNEGSKLLMKEPANPQ
ncbi:Calcium-transporting ATPase lmo0841 [Propionispora sp. 2/2-37]|uniref:cation-translocating P-type ATPase n=1 Tax=Propionispora sp. 2/2-37 TaxID=1677858 RepID=UPI0006BB6C3C|nr:cation-translocating P-type ATPase [Propionispora sp. 2/2-37]CUH96832.1 Calcium-transporting ATPase lmo0841 [Propionispora sp. 2/2-37]